MTRRILAVLVALTALIALAAPAAHAYEWRWSQTLCTPQQTDMRLTVCTQVVYLRWSDGTVQPRHVYAWWSPSEAAYNLDRVQVFGGDARIWWWIGNNLPPYWLSDTLPMGRTAEHRCYVYYDVDGFGPWNDIRNYHYHQCW